jgi:3-oxoacyl-[acyl-carrier protein] reductase
VELGIEGKVALVTGASRGIGRAVAGALTREGARVALSSRSRDGVDAAAAAGGGVGFVHDSDHPGRVDALVSEVEAALGKVEILVINTGGPPAGAPLSFGEEDHARAHRQLVLTPLALIGRVTPTMRARRFGRIVSIASVTVREPLPSLALSTSYRLALLGTVKTLARELAGDGITLNTILPSRIVTERLLSLHGSEASAAQGIPAGRLGSPDDVAAAAVFLASVPAGYVTGTVLPVDGGMLRTV